jgi:hypothetical protein
LQKDYFMRIKSVTAVALGLCVAILLAGCTMYYVHPQYGSMSGFPASEAEVEKAKRDPNSFASQNPGFDFTKQYNDRPSPRASAYSPTGTPGVSAAGAAATTGPMISSPPPPSSW